MFKHKFNRKENTEQGIRYFFDFTNGVKTYTDACIPQDLNGLKFWIKSKQDRYNTEEQLENELVQGQAIDISDPIIQPVTLTKQEIDRNTWLEGYSKWVRIKTNLIDTGILTGNETQIVSFLTDLKANFKPSYINFI